MSYVDKKRLTDAVKLNRKSSKNLEFAWGHKLDEIDIVSSISSNEIGGIPVPISLKVHFFIFNSYHLAII